MESWPSCPIEWRGHTFGVNCIAYSPDGQHIVSGSDDHTLRIWDAETGVAVGQPLKGHTDWVRSVAYSPDGQHIVSGYQDATLHTFKPERVMNTGMFLACFIFVPHNLNFVCISLFHIRW